MNPQYTSSPMGDLTQALITAQPSWKNDGYKPIPVNLGTVDVMAPPLSMWQGGQPQKHYPMRRGGASSPNVWPLKCVDASEGTDYKIRVYFGMVGGKTPSGFAPGDDPPLILDVSGTGYVWATLTTDADHLPTSATISSGSSLPDSSEFSAVVMLGSFSVSGTTLNVAPSVAGSQAYLYCQGGHLWGLQ